MKNYKIYVALLIIIPLLSIHVPLPSISEVPLGPPPPNGDWIVSDQTSINNTTIILNGNLSVSVSGILKLTNVTLVMNGNITVYGEFILRNVSLIMNITGNRNSGLYGISVETGGLMHILDYDGIPDSDDSSIITSAGNDGKHTYTFWVKQGSKFKMENSVLQECGYGYLIPGLIKDHNIGLIIETNNVQIKNSTINYTKNGIIFNSSNAFNNIIFNCTFSRGTSFSSLYYGYYGLAILNGADNFTISGCRFYDITRSLYLFSTGNHTVTDCVIQDSIAQVYQGRDTVGIYSDKVSKCKFINNSEKKQYWGLYFTRSNQITAVSHTIDSTYVGIAFTYDCHNITLENINIINLFNSNPFITSIGLRFYGKNSHIQVINCSIVGNNSARSDGIIWLTPVFSSDFVFKNCSVEVSGVALGPHSGGVLSQQSISDVVIEDSNFLGGQHAFAVLFKLNNWSFLNCSFGKSAYGNFYYLENGIISISNDVNQINFTRCVLKSQDQINTGNGIAFSSYYGLLQFDVIFKDCNISDNSKNGILIDDQGNQIKGTLLFDNCTINGNEQNGIYWYNADLIVNLTNTNISGNGYHGVRMELVQNSEVNIQDSIISKNGYNGISIFNADNTCGIDIDGSSINDNVLNGLKTEFSSCKLTFTNSDLLGNHRSGLNITGCSVLIQKCNMSSNKNSGIIMNGASLNITSSAIALNHGPGLDLKATVGDINGNRILDNDLEGVKIWKNDKNILIINNSVHNNGRSSGSPGVFITESAATVINNTFTTSSEIISRIGIQIYDSSEVVLEENVFNGSFSESIIDIDSSDVQIEKNRLLFCKSQCNGIYGHGASSVRIINNIIAAPGNFGIYMTSGSNGPITNNIISGWNDGIYLSNTILQLNNNNIQHSKEYGIVVKNNAEVSLINNTIEQNSNGVLIEGSAIMTTNLISGSSLNGIHLNNSGDVYLVNNNINKNNVGILIEGGDAATYNNVFEENMIGLWLIGSQKSSFNEDMIIKNDIGLKAEDSIFNLSGFSFEDNINAITLENSYCIIYNSSITSSGRDFILNEGSHGLVINTEITEGSVNIFDAISKLEKQWFLNLTIVNQQDQPIPGMRVIIRDINGKEVFNQTTPEDGSFRDLNLTTMSWDFTGMIDPNPYEIILSKKMYGTIKNELEFSKNTNSTLSALHLSEVITEFSAYDLPNDQGSRIVLHWNSIPILNFGHFNIYVSSDFSTFTESASLINSSITDQTLNSTTINGINGKPLENGKTYYFAISVVDSSGNEAISNVFYSNSVIPRDDISPLTIKNITAFDTPNDNGGSITVTWERSNAIDFSYYEFYCYFANSSYIQDLTTVQSQDIIWDRNTTTIVWENLAENISYHCIILVYDINGNVNLSYTLAGPVIPLDNIPPKINMNSTTPPNNEALEFEINSRKIFKIFLETQEGVMYSWYLDGNLLEDATDSSVIIVMSDLEFGKHTLEVLVEEPSGLYDSMAWNFTMVDIPVKPEEENSMLMLFWMALAILVIFLIIFTLFGIKRVYRYNDAKKTIKTLSILEGASVYELIDKKRKHGDKYVLAKLVEGLPKILKDKPDKLFFILNILAKDDIPEVRENAGNNIAALLDKNPQNVFSWFKMLQQQQVKKDIYMIISGSANDKTVQSLAKMYYANLTASTEEEYQTSLQNTTEVLKDSEALMFGNEMSVLYSTLNGFYKFRTVASISTSKPLIIRILTQKDYSTPLLHPETVFVFEKMKLVAETLAKYEKVDSVEDKLSYLSQSIELLEETSKLTRESLIAPERDIFFLVLNSWRNIISMSIRELRGRADFSFNVIGKEAVSERETVTLVLELENIGRSTAERVLVEIVPSDDYVVLSKAHELGSIGQKKKKEGIFELKPRAYEAFRVEFSIRYDDSERKGKSVSYGDLVTFIQVGKQFIDIPNPYIVGTPVKTGSKLFVGRKDLIDFIQKNIRGSLQENIIILIGHRRTGKTTLLKQLPLYLDKQYIPVYIDIQGIIDPGMEAFFYLLAYEIVETMQARGIDIQVPKFEEFEDRPSFHFEYEFLPYVYEKLGNSILVIMFDEFEELEDKVESGLLDKNIFSYLRHLMQHTKQLAFIFTGSSRLEDLKTDYWSIMFNIALYKRISFLTESETKELIVKPVKEYNMIYDSLAIEKIYRLTNGHPYIIQLLCHAFVNLHNHEKKNYITIQDVNRELYKILERGHMHFDFIWDRSTIMERLVMSALTRVLQEEDGATVSIIVNKLMEYDLGVNSKETAKILDGLEGKGIVTKILDHTTTFEFKVDLIRIWLERTKHLDQIVEEYRAST